MKYFLHKISDMLVYSISPLNSIVSGWMKMQLKKKKSSTIGFIKK